jgi:hypothetical protein
LVGLNFLPHGGCLDKLASCRDAAERWQRTGGVDTLARVMGRASFESIADRQALHLSTVGRVTKAPREIEIWFVACRERF